MMKTETLKLTQEWDKTFPKSEKTDHTKVTFANHFGITLAADMYGACSTGFSCFAQLAFQIPSGSRI